MTRNQQRTINRAVIELIASLLVHRGCRGGYKTIVDILNRQGMTTSRGNAWTAKRLFRMLQRNGISGLWGLSQKLSSAP